MDTVSRIVKNSPMCLHIGHWSLVHADAGVRSFWREKNKRKRNAPTHSHAHTHTVCVVGSLHCSFQ